MNISLIFLKLFIIFVMLNLMQGCTSNEWEQTNIGHGHNVTSIEINSDGEIHVGTSTSLAISKDNGNNWEWSTLSQTCFSVLTPKKSVILIGGNGLEKSTDNGSTWFSNDVILKKNMGRWVNSLAMTSDGKVFAATEIITGDSARVFLSTNNGNNWSSALALKYNDNTKFTSLAISSHDIIYVGFASEERSGSDKLKRSGGIYCSSDQGKNWDKITGGLDSIAFFNIVIPDNGIILTGTSHGLYISTNSGTSWEKNTNIYGDRIQCLQKGPPGHIFAGLGHIGVRHSTDNGKTWNYLGGDKVINDIKCLAYDFKQYLYAGTGNSGLYRLKIHL